MSCVVRPLLIVLVVLLCNPIAAVPVVLAQTSDQQQVDEQIRFAEQLKTIGYVIAGAGIVVIMVGIPLALFWERMKARQRAARQADDASRSSGPAEPRS
jgi:ABC-type sulfate transport system permease component